MVPLVTDGMLASRGLSVVVPFGVSVLGSRVWLGDSGGSGDRGVSRLSGELGRSAAIGVSRSLDLPFPKPLNACPRLEEDFRSGEEARPYGCALCLRRPNTVPKRLRGLELCFSCTVCVSGRL